MNTSGMARKVDDLGRIVLPVEMRRMFGIRPGDSLEIGVDGGTILLRKIESRCVFCDEEGRLTSFRDKQVCTSCSLGIASSVSPEPSSRSAEGVVDVDLLGAPPERQLVHPPLADA